VACAIAPSHHSPALEFSLSKPPSGSFGLIFVLLVFWGKEDIFDYLIDNHGDFC